MSFLVEGLRGGELHRKHKYELKSKRVAPRGKITILTRSVNSTLLGFVCAAKLQEVGAPPPPPNPKSEFQSSRQACECVSWGGYIKFIYTLEVVLIVVAIWAVE